MTPANPGDGGSGRVGPSDIPALDGGSGRKGSTPGERLAQALNRINRQASAEGLMKFFPKNEADCPPNPPPPTNPFVGDPDPNFNPSLDELFGPP